MKKKPRGRLGFTAVVLLLLAIALSVCWILWDDGSVAPVGVCLPILMYHDVRANVALPTDYLIDTATLARDLDALLEEGYEPVSCSQVFDAVLNGRALPPKPLLLVFDDGFRGLADQVLPQLAARRIPALVSVIGARASGIPDGCDTAHNALSWAALRRLCDSGLIELQSHSAYWHVFRSREGASKLPCESTHLYQARFLSDIRAMQALSRHEGVALLPSFAYPYGFVEPDAEPILKAAGFIATMTSEEHVNYLTRDPDCLFRLGRFNRSGLEPFECLLARMACA